MNAVVIIGIILIVWFTIGLIYSYRDNKKQKELKKLLNKRGKRTPSKAYFTMNENVKSKKQRKPNKKSQNSTPKHKNDPTKSIPGSGQQENDKKVTNEGENNRKKKPYRKNKNKKRYYYKNKKKKSNQKKKQPVK